MNNLPYTISINGVDNVGKTTQMRLLPSHYTISKISRFRVENTRIDELHQQGLLQRWWWESTSEDFVYSMVDTLAHRYWNATIELDSKLVLFDRGVAMFEAISVAVIATKRPDHDLDRARMAFCTILEESKLHLPKETFAILLTHGESPIESLQITLSREKEILDERYRLYQVLLQSELQRQERDGVYQHIIRISATSSIGNVQNELREVIFKYTTNSLFLPMLHQLETVYIISGLSNSGKSSIADNFCSHYGTAHAFRARIVYFNDLISEKLGRSMYSLADKEQARELYHELERFSTAHYWLKIIILESMHSHLVTKWLKVWLGDKLRVVYVDTVESLRLNRGLVMPEVIASKDTLKAARGVGLIRFDADLVLDNNDSLANTMNNLLNFDRKGKLKRSGQLAVQ
ncbi:MAG: hypothetical protein Q9197_003145 [Variospora fuerteventurae]